MNNRLITGFILFAMAMTGVVLANMFLIVMIGEINRKRQEGNLVSYFGFTFPKILRIYREYRRSYPNGRAHIFALGAFSVAGVGIVGFAVCLRIIG